MKGVRYFQLRNNLHCILDDMVARIKQEMLEPGDREEDSQSRCLLNRVNDLRHTVQGIELDDIREEPFYE